MRCWRRHSQLELAHRVLCGNHCSSWIVMRDDASRTWMGLAPCMTQPAPGPGVGWRRALGSHSACGMEEHGNVGGISLHVPRFSSGPSGVCMLTYQPGNRSVMFDLLTGHGRDDEEGMQRQSQFRNACGATGWANQARKYLGSASSSGFFPARHSVQRSASIVCLIDLIPFPQHRWGTNERMISAAIKMPLCRRPRCPSERRKGPQPLLGSSYRCLGCYAFAAAAPVGGWEWLALGV
jgi:hypothetical protein